MPSCQHCGKDHGAPPPPACPVTGEPSGAPGLIGQRLDRYDVLSLLGAGGFGAVYRARHVHTEAEVALKVLKRQLSSDPQMLDRLLREAKAAASVGSEHIVRVLDAGVAAQGQAFVAMELLQGMDLKELAYREPLPPMRLTLLMIQVLEALEAAHLKGIVHRDLKPANVFVTRAVSEVGERDFVKLLDFGISKVRQEGALNALTQPGMAMGTPAYMAPEQFFSARDVDGRADLYSAGVMLYELLAGRLPFNAETYADLLVQIRTQAPAPLLSVAPGVPAPLAQVVDRALARDAAQRFASAGAMAQALRSAMGVPSRVSRPPAPAPVVAATPLPAPASAAPLSDASMMGATVTPRPTPGGPRPGGPLSEASMLGATVTPRPLAAPPPPPPPPPGPAPVVHATPVSWPPPAPPPAAPIQALPTPRPAPPASAAAARKGLPSWAIVLIVIAALMSCCVMGNLCGGPGPPM
jgi:serine/threonine-protein kinase